MRAITIHSPWAELIVLGEKRFETRSWFPDETGYPIAIHAGKNSESIADALLRDPFRSVLNTHSICRQSDFKLGHVLGVAWLASCRPTEIVRAVIYPQERAFGDYGDGRFAWELTHVLRFQTPVATRGFQKIWTWHEADMPRDIIAQIHDWKSAIEEQEAVRA
jgi:hypothetical protein